MSFQMPAAAGQPPRRRSGTRSPRNRRLLPTLLILAALVVLFGIFTNLYTDWLWFRSLNYGQVFTKELSTKALLFLLFGALLGGSVAANAVLAYRTRPSYAPMSPELANLERYRAGIEPLRKLIVLATAALLGLIGGSSAAGQWRTFLLWRNRTPFGRNDPQFGVDLAYYMFALPWWRFVLSFLFTVLVLSLIAAAAAHYLYGGLSLQGPGERTTPAARVHLSTLLGLFVLAKAVAYWLDRYSLAVKDDAIGASTFTGLKYTDVQAVLPAKNILAAISLICAALFFANLVRRTWLLPGIGVGLLLLSAILIGSIYPAIVQYFQVRPSEKVREEAFIKRNIDATRDAYDIADAEVVEYEGKTDTTSSIATTGGTSAPNTRLLDPAVVSPTFQQLQQIRQFYGFNDALDIDRYPVDGKLTDVVVAVREMKLPPQQLGNWINDHTVFTHGFGLVAARGDTPQPDGRPTFVESDIPPRGALGDYEPRVYFGETSPNYSIVGGPADAAAQEFDFPDDTAPNGQRNTTYRGAGGVPLGSLFNRVVYAMKLQEEKILLSNAVNSQSRILYVRNPRERVQKVAPWLTLDGDPYPAVVDGRIQWILDGYTTSGAYPYSTRTILEQATRDTVATRTDAVVQQAADRVNYMRNSVKATVDAYDGTVTLYGWDDTDPVLQTWKGAFPGTVKDRSAISPALLAHLRYPQDLFKVQRNLLSRYHVRDASGFYTGEDFWAVPKDPTNGDTDQPPYYLTVQMPGQPTPRFALTTTFVPIRRQNLASFAAVEAEPGDGYGRIRVLRLPRATTTPGPGQAYNAFQADPEVSSALNLLSRGDSQVKLGNLLVLPVAGGLLYVEPVYVQATGTTSYPLLQKVRVSFGNRIGFADTLPQALAGITGGAAPPGEAPAAPGTPSPSPSPSPPSGQPSPAPSGGAGALSRALSEAQKALDEADAALKKGDFTAYGEAQKKLRDAIRRAEQAQKSAPPATPRPSPSTPAPSPSVAPAAGTAGGTTAGAPTSPGGSRLNPFDPPWSR